MLVVSRGVHELLRTCKPRVRVPSWMSCSYTSAFINTPCTPFTWCVLAFDSLIFARVAGLLRPTLLLVLVVRCAKGREQKRAMKDLHVDSACCCAHCRPVLTPGTSCGARTTKHKERSVRVPRDCSCPTSTRLPLHACMGSRCTVFVGLSIADGLLCLVSVIGARSVLHGGRRRPRGGRRQGDTADPRRGAGQHRPGAQCRKLGQEEGLLASFRSSGINRSRVPYLSAASRVEP